MRVPFVSYRQGDPDLMGRNHKHMTHGHEFGERPVWIAVGLLVLMMLATSVALVA